MDQDSLRTVAVWTVIVVGFVGLAGFLSTRNQLTPSVVAIYWFPPAVLVLIGAIPAPWQPLVGR